METMLAELQREHSKMKRVDIYDEELKPIYKTNDYSKFKVIGGNRKIQKNHLARLYTAMKKKYLLIPIMVNRDFGIVDGQHRFINVMRLGLPVFYYFNEDYELAEVQKLNTNMTNWTSNNYMEGFADLGIIDYVKYREYRKEFGFGHGELRSMLSGSNSYEQMAKFKDGTFKILQEEEFLRQARLLNKIKPFYTGYQKRNFVKAMVILFRHPEVFKFDNFIKKISYNSEILVDCTTVRQYLGVIEELYNFKTKQKNIVSLRYLR